MADEKRSPHAHGRSEIWLRRSLVTKIKRENARLGRRLRELRQAVGLTQEAAAETSGVHAKHIQRVELGSANPTLATLVALADAYGVSLSELFAET